MEHLAAIETAKMWLETGKGATEKRAYPMALYSLEMATEIALKGVLIALGIDAPKTHNMVPVIKSVFDEEERKLPKEFVNRRGDILDTLSFLLELRSVGEYTFERSIDMKELKLKAEEYFDKVEEIISLSRLAINHLEKRRK